MRINQNHARAAAVRDQHATFAGDDTCRFWKAVERRNMPVGVSINHLKTIASHVSNKNAAALWLESSMVKRCTR